MSQTQPPAPGPQSISAPPPKRCPMCGIELQALSAHLNTQQCVRDLIQRIQFLRQITLAQAGQLEQQGLAIIAQQRFAYAILNHLTEGANRCVLERSEFEKLPEGVAITMVETDGGDFEIVGVVPEKKEAKTS